MTKSDRIYLIDALRGFALLTIAVAHFTEQYLGNLAPEEHAGYTQHLAIDGLLDGISFALIRGKGFALFSFMFGLSFYLQMQRAEAKDDGSRFTTRFAWRLMLLLVIGYAHSLIYAGDILMIYAVLGLFLIPLRNLSDRWLWTIGLVFILGLPRVLMAIGGGGTSPEQAAELQTTMQAQAVEHWNNIANGDLLAIVARNGTQGMGNRLNFQFGPISRGYQTFGLFLIGLWAGRRGLLANPDANRATLRKMLLWGGGLTLAIPIVGGLAVRALMQAFPSDSTANETFDLLSWPSVMGFCFYDAWNFAMTLFYVALFVKFFESRRVGRFLRSFVGVGKTALTCYVSQSAIGLLIFSGLGLGLLGKVGTSTTILMAIVVFGMQMLVSQLWLARFLFGPLEWIWRCLTYGAMLPLKNPATPAIERV